jgi:hypothetical protein
MRIIITEETRNIAAGNSVNSANLVRDPLMATPNMISHPRDWHIPSIAGGLFLITTISSSAATASLKPNIPLWGMPVTVSLGLGLCGTAIMIGLIVDKLQSEH